jgi:hypothetical protein
LDQALIELDSALTLAQERADALIACEQASPPVPVIILTLQSAMATFSSAVESYQAGGDA